MIQQQAFKGSKKMLKGALHCHTTRSDGKLTQEQMMEIYKEHGYDFMAFTDHGIYNFKNFVPESGMIVIPGMEFGNLIYQGLGRRCYHSMHWSFSRRRKRICTR